MSSRNNLHFGTYTPYEKPQFPNSSQKIVSKIVDKKDLVNLRLGEAQKSGRHTDVTFTFNARTEVVKAHKLVLALASSIFETMFFTTAWQGGHNVQITDIDLPIFNIFIEYLYTSMLPKYIPILDAIQVLYAARKYCVEDLELTLKEYLKDSITINTVLPILKTSVMLDYPNIESKCWECIDLDTDRLVTTDEFTSLDLPTVVNILDRDSLTIPEGKLFNAVLRWGEEECIRQDIQSTPSNLKIVVGETMRKIRFPVMDPKEFADGPATSGLLTQEEISNTLLTKFCSNEKKPPQIFSPKKRVPKKILSSLQCHCRSSTTVCTFCQDRDGSNLLAGKHSSIHFCMCPIRSYCACRTRDYCPSRKIV